ncbi:hypothetical protein MC885_006010 [Smutsia gigantea]|nr:hypothetical protein MC885_006010 [Smutsia gigantea]
MLAASSSKTVARRESAASNHRGLLEEEGATAGADQGEPLEPGRDPLPSWRPQPDGEASQTEEVDDTWGPSGSGQGKQGLTRPPQQLAQGPLPTGSPSQDFSFIEVSGGWAQGSGGLEVGAGTWVRESEPPTFLGLP